MQYHFDISMLEDQSFVYMKAVTKISSRATTSNRFSTISYGANIENLQANESKKRITIVRTGTKL